MTKHKSILLADDDADDCTLFEEAFQELDINASLKIAKDGIELMNFLEETVPPPPDVIFLDLNMPLKNGFECLTDIKNTQRFKDIPVVVFSTSSDRDSIEKVYAKGAHHYICKPRSFSKLKTVIDKVIAIDWDKNQPSRDRFLLSV